jgi:hemerythrin-like domain-containing protein
MKSMLEKLKDSNTSDNDFLVKIGHLKTAVTAHVGQEETTVFAAIRINCSDEQQQHLATQFKAAKSKLQDQSLAKAA